MWGRLEPAEQSLLSLTGQLVCLGSKLGSATRFLSWHFSEIYTATGSLTLSNMGALENSTIKV